MTAKNTGGSTTAGVSLEIDPAGPVIVLQPRDVGIQAGAQATFTVVARDSNPLTYEWFESPAAVPSSSGAPSFVVGTAVGDVAPRTFRVKVTNTTTTLSVLSTDATLTLGPGTCLAGGAMRLPRAGHTATLLRDGRVLIVGGETGTATTDSAELYDPVSKTFSFSTSLHTPRSDHAATLLADGRVLIVGGTNTQTFSAVSSAEVFEFDAQGVGHFTVVGDMSAARYGPTATLLPDGRVLALGGQASTPVSDPVALDLWSPLTSGFSTAGVALNFGRLFHTANLMNDGSVVVVGGYSDTLGPLSRAEVLQWGSGGTLTVFTVPMKTARQHHTATRLPTGALFVFGGIGSTGQGVLGGEVYSPGDTAFVSSNVAATTARYDHTATLLPSGRVMYAGGRQGTLATDLLSSVHVYEPANVNLPGMATSATLTTARTRHTATLLSDGKVLLTGGYVAGAPAEVPTTSSETYW